MYKYVAAFGLGAVVGAIGTMLWLRKEYNKKVEEAAIEQQKRHDIPKESKEKTEEPKAKEEVEDKNFNKAYEKMNRELIKRHGYSSDDAESVVRDEKPVDEKKETPYGISDEDFLMSKREYNKISLLFYDDGVLACEDGTVVEDVLYTLGPKWMSEVGKYEGDVAYIRNDSIGSDYEVIIQHLNYADEYGPEVN